MFHINNIILEPSQAEPAAQETKQQPDTPPKKVVMAPEAAEAEAENADDEDATVEVL